MPPGARHNAALHPPLVTEHTGRLPTCQWNDSRGGGLWPKFSEQGRLFALLSLLRTTPARMSLWSCERRGGARCEPEQFRRRRLGRHHVDKLLVAQVTDLAHLLTARVVDADLRPH